MSKPNRKGVIYNDAGKPFSSWKATEKFAYVWHQEGCMGFPLVAEHRFHPVRRWRLDFAWPAYKVGLEIDGLGFAGGMGRHQTPAGQAKDNEKLNAAIELGWRVLRFNSRNLGSKQGVSEAVELVCRVLEGSLIVSLED